MTENKFCKIRDDEYLCTQVKTFISQKFCQKIGGHKLLVVNKGFFHQEMFLPRLAQIKFLEQTSLHIYQTFHKSKDSLHFVIFLGKAHKFSVFLCLFVYYILMYKELLLDWIEGTIIRIWHFSIIDDDLNFALSDLYFLSHNNFSSKL